MGVCEVLKGIIPGGNGWCVEKEKPLERKGKKKPSITKDFNSPCNEDQESVKRGEKELR